MQRGGGKLVICDIESDEHRLEKVGKQYTFPETDTTIDDKFNSLGDAKTIMDEDLLPKKEPEKRVWLFSRKSTPKVIPIVNSIKTYNVGKNTDEEVDTNTDKQHRILITDPNNDSRFTYIRVLSPDPDYAKIDIMENDFKHLPAYNKLTELNTSILKLKLDYRQTIIDSKRKPTEEQNTQYSKKLEEYNAKYKEYNEQLSKEITDNNIIDTVIQNYLKRSGNVEIPSYDLYPELRIKIAPDGLPLNMISRNQTRKYNPKMFHHFTSFIHNFDMNNQTVMETSELEEKSAETSDAEAVVTETSGAPTQVNVDLNKIYMILINPWQIVGFEDTGTDRTGSHIKSKPHLLYSSKTPLTIDNFKTYVVKCIEGFIVQTTMNNTQN